MTQVDLDTCAREPIHIPGAIQPHGIFFAVDAAGAVGVVSDNVSDLGWPVAELVGQPLAPRLGGNSGVIAELLSGGPLRVFNVTIGGRSFTAIPHRSGPWLCLELEPSFGDSRNDGWLRLVDHAMEAVRETATLEHLLGAVVRAVRDLTGFDRVMVYRFHPDEHGEVIAEERSEGLEAFLGLHYPASDIPAQARRMYLINPLRIIPDIAYRSVPLSPPHDPPIDLTHSTLRSVSPVHVEYLTNMGVRASMSISLVSRGRLWGLIACHHYGGPHYVHGEVRRACAHLASLFSSQVTEHERVDSARAAARIAEARAELATLSLRRQHDDPTGETATRVCAAVGATGALVLDADGRCHASSGAVPDATGQARLGAWLHARTGPDVLAEAALPVAAPELELDPGVVAGVLAIHVPVSGGRWLVWMRPEAPRVIDWAGAPHKVYSEGPLGPRLTPRGSFELWRETMRGTSMPWSETDVAIAAAARAVLVETELLRVNEERGRARLQAMLAHIQGLLLEGSATDSMMRDLVTAMATGLDAGLMVGCMRDTANVSVISQIRAGTAVVAETELAADLDGAMRGDREVSRPLPGDHVDAFARHGYTVTVTAGAAIIGALAVYTATPLGEPAREVVRRIAALVGLALARQELERRQRALMERESSARREAEEANRLKDDFLATVSHELRTPLNAMVGWIHLLRNGLPPDRQQRAVEVLQRNARAQTQLIDDLLDVSRMLSGRLLLELELVEVSAIIGNAVEAVRPAADAKGVRLQVACDSAGAILGDPRRLQQVLWNLVVNAVKFTPRGGRVHLTCLREHSAVEVAVADTGQGITAEFLPHVFERFRQEDGGTSRRSGGLGLGLSITKHLVELHGGRIMVASDGPGRGATFTVRLPIALSRPREAAAPPAADPTPTAAGRLAGVRIVAVDDEPDSIEVLASMLESEGAEVRSATSARDALAAIAADPPHLVISDIGMPDLDGYELVHELQSLTLPDLPPAIALTAYARSEERTRALTAGFAAHIAKPVEPEELIAVVRAVLRRPR